MTSLDQLIQHAFHSEGKQDDVNQVYLTLLQTMLFVPVKKEKNNTPEEPFSPLFAKLDDRYFMCVFDTLPKLQSWAADLFNDMHYVELSGRDVIAGINDQVYLSLNVGTSFYKEFSPDEVKRLKMIVSKIDQFKS